MTFTHAPAVAGLGVGLYLSAGFVRDLYFAFKSKAWPTTAGKVIDINIARTNTGRGTYSSANIAYEYQVRGVRYTSRRIDYAGRGGGWPGALNYTRRYSDGQGVAVRYDPNEPERSVLETGARPGNFVRILLAFIVIAFAILALLAS
jgi:hypothetical protein